MRVLLVVYLLLLLASPAGAAEQLVLKGAAAPNGVHTYYHALVRDALVTVGIDAVVDPQPTMPQPRLEAALREGTVDIHYFLRTPERDRDFIPITVGLTDGLIAHRIMLIRSADQAAFNGIDSLSAFKARGFTAGFGQNWFDALVWNHNGLTFREVGGDYRRIFSMLAHGNREIDYFPRGLTEILAEADVRSGLAIEQQILFRYRNDQIFYLSPALAYLQPVLQNALTQMSENGVIRSRARAFWGPAIEALRIDDRIVIDLELPIPTE